MSAFNLSPPNTQLKGFTRAIKENVEQFLKFKNKKKKGNWKTNPLQFFHLC